MNWPFDQGWNAIWDKTKHFMVSFFAVICLFGLPLQYLHVDWNRVMLLIVASAVTMIIGLVWELLGNKDKWDALADFCGIVLAVILIGV